MVYVNKCIFRHSFKTGIKKMAEALSQWAMNL